MNLAILSDQDFENMAFDIQEIQKAKSQDELFEILGNALFDSGLTVAPEHSKEATVPLMHTYNNSKALNICETIDFVADPLPLEKEEATSRGKGLLKRIKTAICSNKAIKDFLTGDNELKSFLKTGIPVILALVSSSLTLGPLGLAIAAVIIALLIKVGYEAFCEVSI